VGLPVSYVNHNHLKKKPMTHDETLQFELFFFFGDFLFFVFFFFFFFFFFAMAEFFKFSFFLFEEATPT